MFCDVNRETYQWKRIESPKMYPNRYANLTYDKEAISNHRNKNGNIDNQYCDHGVAI